MNKKKIGFVMLLILLLIILLVFVYNLININKNNTSVNKEEINSEKNEEGKVEILDLNSTLVQNLYKYIVKYNQNDEETVYQNRKVTFNDISDSLKIITVFNCINLEEEKDDLRKVTLEEMYDQNYYYEYIFKKDTIDKKAKEIFGNETILIPPTKQLSFKSDKVKYKDGKYIADTFGPNGLGDWLSLSLLEKAEKIGNKVYLYDKYVHMDNLSYPDCYRKRYNASDRKVLLPELTKEEIDKYINNINNNLVFKNSNTFKHTFKINDNGLYNWISSEIVK